MGLVEPRATGLMCPN